MPTLELVSHHLCPYVQRAVIALTEKAVPFRRTYIDLALKPAWFTAISPLGKVPLLRIVEPDKRNTVLFESSVICEYLEDTQPNPLHPADPLERARHRAFIEFGSAILSDIWGFETAQDQESTERKAADLQGKFAHVEEALTQRPYFGGRRFSLVDATFGPVFRYFDVFDTIADFGIFAKTPKVLAWRGALLERTSVRFAVEADYAHRLRVFLAKHFSHLHKLAA
jgi:glutathione S-transferase